MSLALRTYASWIDGARGAPHERLNRYALFGKREAGSRAEICFGLAEDASELGRVEVVKVFFPPQAGPALDGLTEELALASKLAHDNVVRTSNVGFDSGRYFLVNEYLEGTTLASLLAWITSARVRMPNAAVARVLLALVAAVDHALGCSSGSAQGLAGSAAARALIQQPILAEDVYVTHDGSVKLLGFKSRIGSAFRSGKADGLSSAPAVDALLSQHLTPELGAVLAEASASTRASGGGSRARSHRFAEALEQWQADNGSDGAAELACLMVTGFGSDRKEQRARLEAAAADSLRARQGRHSLIINIGDELAPVSGFRRILG
jgi:hypothetical protein